jgi:hypothetical protein
MKVLFACSALKGSGQPRKGLTGPEPRPTDIAYFGFDAVLDSLDLKALDAFLHVLAKRAVCEFALINVSNDTNDLVRHCQPQGPDPKDEQEPVAYVLPMCRR